ncbi:MAG TPA: hypothetical protein VL098_07545 [Flavipsychrobacter sp.]|nr:hypothetical protein [Flavipsychrobacter sp.]
MPPTINAFGITINNMTYKNPDNAVGSGTGRKNSHINFEFWGQDPKWGPIAMSCGYHIQRKVVPVSGKIIHTGTGEEIFLLGSMSIVSAVHLADLNISPDYLHRKYVYHGAFNMKGDSQSQGQLIKVVGGFGCHVLIDEYIGP